VQSVRLSKEYSMSFRCGTIALIGRPNVGKSTLLNALIGAHLAATARKPQTTRHRILGLATDESAQLIFIDTPGIHQKAQRALNRQLNKTAAKAISEVDVLAFVVDGIHFEDDDALALKHAVAANKSVLLVINKIDRVTDKERLLPFVEAMYARHKFTGTVMVSATKRKGLEELKKALAKLLPVAEAQYDADDLTDRPERFLAAEFVREQLIRLLGEELPYSSTVTIDEFTLEPKLKRIQATIWVERDGQKAIVIGEGGARLKEIGTKSRIAMERIFDSKVFLSLWVKVKSGWSDDERALRQMGYGD
jgi:GTPase